MADSFKKLEPSSRAGRPWVDGLLPGQTFKIHTLGCKSNLSDSEAVDARLQNEGLSRFESTQNGSAPDWVWVNTCSVTDSAHQESLEWIRRYRRDFPKARVIAMGCASEVEPSMFEAPEVERLSQVHPMDRPWPSVGPERSSHTRAFVKIQEGCDAFCTYCIIPYGRGPSRSMPEREVLRAVAQKWEQGFREIILTATNLGDYFSEAGTPKSWRLSLLIDRIFQETPVDRLRLTSLDPSEITEPLLERFDRWAGLCRHLHVSLQSPHGRILRRMKRKYSTSDVESCLAALGKMDGMFVGADLITGFPGESESDFQWSLEAMRSWPWTRLHVFPYSERGVTPATRLDGVVPVLERKARAKQWQALSFERQREWIRKHASPGTTLREVLLEKPVQKSDGRWIQKGQTRSYLTVKLSGGPYPRNTLVSAQIEGIEEDPIAHDFAVLGRVV